MMQSITRLNVLIILGVALFGCAVVDTSILETAEPLKKGHMKFGAQAGLGFDLSLASAIHDSLDGSGEPDELLSMPVIGGSIGFGLDDQNELNAKLWLSIFSVGSKIYVKHSIPTESPKTGLAILPGLDFVSFADPDDPRGSVNNPVKFYSYGAFLPVLAHFKANDYFYLYGSARYSFDLLTIRNSHSEIDGSFVFHRLGLTAGLSIQFKALYLRPELGMEYVKINDSHIGYLPTINLGLGLEL